MKKPKLTFRKAALEHASSSPEQLNQLIRITSANVWIFAVVLYAVLIAIVLWGFFGSIAIRVEGQGILLAEKGGIYSAISPEGSGHVIAILVSHGDKVKKGQVLAHLERPNLIKEVKITQEYLKHLRNEYSKLALTAKEQIKQQQQHYANQTAVLKKTIQFDLVHLEKIKELLAIKQKAFKRGIHTRESVMATVNNYYSTKSQIEQLREKLIQNKISERNAIDQWEERLRNLDLKIKDEQHKLNNLQSKLQLSQNVYSPIDGIVSAIQKTRGDVVKAGDTVVSIASMGKGMDAIVYISPEDGKRVKPKMRALGIEKK